MVRLVFAIALFLTGCNTNGTCSRAYVISKAEEASIDAPELNLEDELTE